MTMIQKMQAKKSKKGFTLVELVIVIAILAILAAIAIPVITTTINSSKMSVLESDTATVNMLVKEAVNNRAANISTTKYAGTEATSDDLTVHMVLAANDIDDADDFYARSIGGTTYTMGYTTTGDGALSIGVDVDDATDISGDTKIKDLAQAAGLEAGGAAE